MPAGDVTPVLFVPSVFWPLSWNGMVAPGMSVRSSFWVRHARVSLIGWEGTPQIRQAR
jgi:hypothetical protein